MFPIKSRKKCHLLFSRWLFFNLNPYFEEFKIFDHLHFHSSRGYTEVYCSFRFKIQPFEHSISQFYSHIYIRRWFLLRKDFAFISILDKMHAAVHQVFFHLLWLTFKNVHQNLHQESPSQPLSCWRTTSLLVSISVIIVDYFNLVNWFMHLTQRNHV